MPWVRFVGDFDFKPRPAVTLAFRRGDVRLVTRRCAEAARAAGKAEVAIKPRGDEHDNPRRG